MHKCVSKSWLKLCKFEENVDGVVRHLRWIFKGTIMDYEKVNGYFG